MSVRFFAPAKINLTLEVGRPRVDGLHPLQSAVVFADVGDSIEASPANDLTLAISGEFAAQLPIDEDNLVLRAAHALAAHAGVARGAALSLEKNLPVASGIGSGSADAAATLRALNELWALNLDSADLAGIGAKLGADIPVCVAGAPAYVAGIGECVAAISAPQLAAVLINPLRPLATVDVYRAFDQMGLGDAFEARSPPDWRRPADAAADIARIGNHLEAPARSLLPQIDEMLVTLRADARVDVAAMSGSGATVFAIVANLEAAAALADHMQGQHPDWWIADTLLGGA